MEPPAEAETDPPRSTPRNASLFCIMCQKLFAKREVESRFEHYTTWTALIRSAASGCILCSQMMSALLKDRQEELLPRFKEDAELNNVGIICLIHPSYSNEDWSLNVYRHDSSRLQLEPMNWVSFTVYETSGLYNFTGLTSIPIETTTQRTDDEKTWQNILRWLLDCLSNHADCNFSSNEDLWMPSRIIDVLASQSSDAKEDKVFLITTKDLSPLCKYATLSHCWGGQVPVQLNKETRSQLISGYSVDSLPRTFADAVRITRRLGLRYVWIDSLCIKQDSEEDWRKESQTMHQVYSQSWCNIAASASKDSSVGCFFDWNTKFAQPFEADTLWTTDPDGHRTFVPHTFVRENMWFTYVYEDVLDQRGWVMQERILPARQLSFTKAGVFWECRCLLANPYLPDEFPTNDQRHFYKDFAKKLEEIATNQPPVSKFGREHALLKRTHAIQDTYRAWDDIIKVYSRGKLTKATDRLVAISGLAKRMREAVGDEYFAGLWKSRFFSQLCWTVKFSTNKFSRSLRRPRPLLAPTWSWASTLQPIEMPRVSETTSPLSEALEVNLQHPTDDSTGEVIGGFLRLRTVLEPVDLPLRENIPGLPFALQAWMMPATGFLDEKFTEQETCGKFFCIPLSYDKSFKKISGILLRSTCGGQSGYERIGLWEIVQLAREAKEDVEAKVMRMAESWINELQDLSEKGTAPSYQDIVIY